MTLNFAMAGATPPTAKLFLQDAGVVEPLKYRTGLKSSVVTQDMNIIKIQNIQTPKNLLYHTKFDHGGFTIE